MRKRYDIRFTKAVASGNDFIIIDNKNRALDKRAFDYPEMARDLCRRSFSIGADGLLVLETSRKADFKMRIINPDGSEVTMCGNGSRASALYAARNGWGDDLTIETGAGLLESHVKGDHVKIKMSEPKDIKLNIKLPLKSGVVEVHHINSGVPHVVYIVNNLESFDVKNIGCEIRKHKLFAPGGTNANFVGKITKKSASIRTYERGVEDETLACGTGSVASAVVLGLLGHVSSPVKMLTRSGETLTVYYKISGKKVTDVYFEGIASLVFEGRV